MKFTTVSELKVNDATFSVVEDQLCVYGKYGDPDFCFSYAEAVSVRTWLDAALARTTGTAELRARIAKLDVNPHTGARGSPVLTLSDIEAFKDQVLDIIDEFMDARS